MGRRLLKTTRVGSCSVKIYRDSEYDVFVVRSSAGKNRTYEYETNIERDAQGTAAHQEQWLKKQPSCRAAGGGLAGARRRNRRRR